MTECNDFIIAIHLTFYSFFAFAFFVAVLQFTVFQKNKAFTVFSVSSAIISIFAAPFLYNWSTFVCREEIEIMHIENIEREAREERLKEQALQLCEESIQVFIDRLHLYRNDSEITSSYIDFINSSYASMSELCEDIYGNSISECHSLMEPKIEIQTCIPTFGTSCSEYTSRTPNNLISNLELLRSCVQKYGVENE